MAIRQTEVKLREIQRNAQEKRMNNNKQKHIITKMPNKYQKKERIYGSIVEVIGDKVYFQLPHGLDYFSKFTHVVPDKECYFIRFMNDRTTISLQHQALDNLHKDDITEFFFPNLADIQNSSWEKPDPIFFDQKS